MTHGLDPFAESRAIDGQILDAMAAATLDRKRRQMEAKAAAGGVPVVRVYHVTELPPGPGMRLDVDPSGDVVGVEVLVPCQRTPHRHPFEGPYVPGRDA